MKTSGKGRETTGITTGKFDFKNSLSIILSENGTDFSRCLFLMPKGHRKPHIRAARCNGHWTQPNRKTPGKPRKNGNPGAFLDGRDGRGPLNSTPEVTAAVPRGQRLAARDDSIAEPKAKRKGSSVLTQR